MRRYLGSGSFAIIGKIKDPICPQIMTGISMAKMRLQWYVPQLVHLF